MITLTIKQNILFTQSVFSDINELKKYIYEKFWAPCLDEELEKKWYKNNNLELEEEKFSSVSEMKNFYLNLRK